MEKGTPVWVVFKATYEGKNVLGEPIVSWSEATKEDEYKPRSNTVPKVAVITKRENDALKRLF